ncbi:MAG: choice-of-anchor B family protein [bacterium]|nr:choice-of-anchor B family protein [bacterium]
MQVQLARRVIATLSVGALTVPLFGHDDDPKLLDRTPSYRGPGYSPGLGGNPVTGQSVGFSSQNVYLRSWLTMSDLGVAGEEGSDCWGYTSPSGREYAIFTSSTDTIFIEITIPSSPQIIAHIDGSNSIWRDVKVWGDRAYIVTEGGGGIQVVSMANIDSGTVTLVGTAGTGSTHNIALDETSGYAYRCGGSSNGLRIYDLNANPDDPPQVAVWNDRYVHDAQIVTYTSGPLAGQQIAYCCAGLNGGGTDTALTILDVTDKNNIVQLSQTPYPNREYSHQGWLSPDRQYFYLGDELDEPSVPSTVYIIDVADPSNPSVVGQFDNGNTAITHNLYTRDNFIFAANYRSGIRVFDATTPTAPVEVGFYDTFPGSDSADFNGLWSLYPYFPSGVIIGSDVERGLFVWQVSFASLTVDLPMGVPSVLDPRGVTLPVTIAEGAPGDLMPGTEVLVYDDGSGPQTVPLTNNGAGNYDAVFPALTCGSEIVWQVQAETIDGVPFSSGGGTAHVSLAVDGIVVVAEDEVEAPGSWTSGAPADTATTGIWEHGDPIGTAAQPEDDHTPSGTNCWFTGQGTLGGPLGEQDIDGGATTLLSPVMDLSSSATPQLSYWRWYTNDGNGNVDDSLVIEITDDGMTWYAVEILGPGHPEASGGWFRHDFNVLSIPGMSLTSTVQVRFVAADQGNGSIVEAAVDDLRIEELYCDPGVGAPYCPGVTNSIGREGRLTALGSDVVTDNNVTLEASDLPTGQFGCFLVSQTQGAPTQPGGSMGNLCLAAPMGFFYQNVGNTGASGSLSALIDLAAIPMTPPVSVQAGETWSFQCWYRDQPASNFTNGYSILFQ